MSALGHKQTFGTASAMSVLPQGHGCVRLECPRGVYSAAVQRSRGTIGQRRMLCLAGSSTRRILMATHTIGVTFRAAISESRSCCLLAMPLPRARRPSVRPQRKVHSHSWQEVGLGQEQLILRMGSTNLSNVVLPMMSSKIKTSFNSIFTVRAKVIISICGQAQPTRPVQLRGTGVSLPGMRPGHYPGRLKGRAFKSWQKDKRLAPI
jgi:hypothetical protein